MSVMLIGGVAGGIASGGINAGNQQAQIKQQFCQLANQMAQYKTLINSEVSLLSAANAEVQQEIFQLASQILSIKETIRTQHAIFKKTYNQWIVVGVIFLLILIFLFATKKFILGATTEPFLQK